MKCHLLRVLIGLIAFVSVKAGEAPSSFADTFFLLGVSSATGSLQNKGAFRYYFGNDLRYSNLSLSPNLNGSTGTYTSKLTSSSEVALTINDSLIGVANCTFKFRTAGSGEFTIVAAGGTQSGEFALFAESPQTFINMSVRLVVAAKGNAQPAFVLRKSGKFLIRAVGPSLSLFGLTGMPDPKMKIYRLGGVQPEFIKEVSGAPLSAGDQKILDDASATAHAFPLKPGSADAACVIDLDPGAYSAVVESNTGTAGELIVEVYGVSTGYWDHWGE